MTPPPSPRAPAIKPPKKPRVITTAIFLPVN